ncbi:MAG TPA: isochorismate synthase [Kiritimatiellia bacterium]|nr:isochorismate synthase [Kiritimatiellia bacterium]HMP00229.1 isochorismate synthase [Kiritimatiellia bacterium]HMP97182.1 isochorismate synthase [Kiritimatiellia bacterium]
MQIGVFDSVEAAARSMAEEVARQAPTLAGANGIAGLRWEAVVPDTDPLAWLNYHNHLIRMYCSNRERRLQIAAIGVADMLRYKDEEIAPREALDYVFSRLNVLPPGVRYYGGMRFHDHPRPDDPTWRRFGRIRFVLPSVELIRDEQHTVLAANLVASPDLVRDGALLTALLKHIKTPPILPAAHLPQPVSRANNPDRDQWETMVLRAYDALTSGTLTKIVLARRCLFDFGEPLQPMALLQRLHEVTPDSFHFCFNYGDEIAFIGATPERLYQRKGATIISEALAGTRPRGATEEDDRWLESELMASAKERQEHHVVADAITRILSGFCDHLDQHDKPEVLKLRYVQHLRTVITGQLKTPFSDADLLLALHPTPAVGGCPKQDAVERIDELEPFDRGWYAAPIGWAMKDEVEFAVAIRCGLVEGSRLALFSGAGIMPDSDPEMEWREIESKIGSFLRILTT